MTRREQTVPWADAVSDGTQDSRAATQDGRAAAQDARTAAQDARSAAQDAKAAAQHAIANAQPPTPPALPAPPRPPGTIVIPSDGGDAVSISVDGSGIHVTQGESSTTIPIRDVVPRGAVQMTYAICAMLVAVAFVGPLVRFFLRRHERRAVSATLSAGVQARLDAMDRNIDTIAVELERVSEGQRFTSKLLEQRPREAVPRLDR